MNTCSFTPAEHGLSYLIEFDGKRILFDAGQSDMFLKNAKKMEVSSDKRDYKIFEREPTKTYFTFTLY